MHNLNNKIALITGASSPKDIGSAICRRLASQGMDIFFTYWKAEKVGWKESLIKEMEEFGVRCDGLEVDLSNANAADCILDSATSSLGFPSILVNNAAHSASDGFRNLDANTLDNHYAVNMRSTFLLCVEFARRYEKLHKDSGRIINLTSGQDIGGMPGELAYVATKGAISAFTKTLAVEVAPLGITVNAINPGPTDSTWMTDEIREHLLPKFLMGRIGLPEDAARLVGFLASDDSTWITGQVIHSEGGYFRS
ncbi:SDR family oxidoreductase [Bacillus sp. FJAT-49736]|uniref:SDR family oxidoreductase n=1 Tax=Bacillus sp. FJAT-49736 TaxID=2833582 RepID=UPI001BCA2072|nr:SDR family oxidoreductase [Bacillus sp. FJAT-49736]MBS4172689.1 SDR family oxidoreductase [Bacillus sp. FJAT-49736]